MVQGGGVVGVFGLEVDVNNFCTNGKKANLDSSSLPDSVPLDGVGVSSCIDIFETEIKQEYKTTKVLKNEHDVSMDHAKLPEEFLVNWIKFRDIQPSPPPYASSKLNPEIDILFRQDTPSPTSLAGPWSVSGRSKRKASDDRFEPYFNPKRRAVSPSLVGLTAKGNLRGNSNLVNIHDANGSFSRLNLNSDLITFTLNESPLDSLVMEITDDNEFVENEDLGVCEERTSDFSFLCFLYNMNGNQ
ncbi:13830_t:CDS:2 [Entrophospora sp. SA101]|nr:13830_t:CDS:2 [Entrophospora sp. SA101]